MNKRKRFILLLVLIYFFIFIDAFTIFIVRSKNNENYEKFLSSFKDRARFDFIIFDFNKKSDAKNIKENINLIKPDAILLIGEKAINNLINEIKNVPIIISMISDTNGINKKQNVCGILSYHTSAYLAEFLNIVFPKVEKIGIIFDINTSMKFAKDFKNAESDESIVYELGNINTKNDIEMMIKMLKISDVEMLLIENEGIIKNNDVMNEIIRVSKKENIPFISLNEQYKEHSIGYVGFNLDELGYKTGDIAIRIFNGEKPIDLGFTLPEKYNFYFNRSISADLINKINDSIYRLSEKY